MYLEAGKALTGHALAQLKAFLRSNQLDYDPAVDFTVRLMEDGEIIATGSLDGATLKCIAVSPEHQGEDLASRLVTALMQEAFRRGQEHLMLFTKPANQLLFRGFGFYPVMRTGDCLLMENKRGGLDAFLSGLEKPEGKIIGCIVANCNPFTLGHRYLVETAATQCDALHLFVLSEAKSAFSPEERMELVRRGCADLKNVFIHPTGPYMVSSATFPSYFIKDKARVQEIYCELDIRLFGEKIAPALGITRRYVGTEPNCAVTRFYNEQMKKRLPAYGIDLMEIPRLESNSEAISASRVRTLLAEGRTDDLRTLLPKTTLSYLLESHPFP